MDSLGKIIKDKLMSVLYENKGYKTIKMYYVVLENVNYLDI